MGKKRNSTIYEPNSFYHVYNRGNHKEVTFFDSHDYLRFLQTLERFSKGTNLVVYGYCLMPNHYHLLIKSGDDMVEIPEFMHRCMTSYVRYFNLRHKFVGRLFQGPFKVKLLPGVEDILKVIKYFERNPVKAGLVKNSEDYRWLRISLNIKEDINLK